MTKAKIPQEELEKMEGLNAKAATAVSRDDPGDSPSEVNDDIPVDFDFLKYDPSDFHPYLIKAGLEEDPRMSYAWVEKDLRVWPRSMAHGWKPVAGGKISRGTVVLCSMPKARREAILEHGRQRARDLLQAPMRRVDMEADKYRKSGFSTFDGPKSLRDGLD